MGFENYQARNFLRTMRPGDQVLFYHSSTDLIGCVGVAEVTSEAKPDPTQFQPKSSYFGPKSEPDKPRWYGVDIKFVSEFTQIVLLSKIKTDRMLKTMLVAKPGNRLSITPLSQRQFERVCELGSKGGGGQLSM